MQTQFRGQFGRLEKLSPTKHGAGLWAVLKDQAALWDYMAYGPFETQTPFLSFLEEIAAKPDPYFYCVLDKQNIPVGWLSLMEIRPTHKVCEVGHIVFSPAMQRSPLASEAVFMLMQHAFKDLSTRRFEWKCNNQNLKSKAAATRFGFTFEGIFRQHMLVKGVNRDTAWFSILDKEWPLVRDKFTRWLSPQNFDTNGQQLKSLREM